MIALSWSGGKDSARALEQLREDGASPDLLLTTVDEESRRVTHHGVSTELLRIQARAAGLPLLEIPIPRNAASDVYSAAG
jgi:diphthamide synthase (EF-2-diphthine--ammonia ligase)